MILERMIIEPLLNLMQNIALSIYKVMFEMFLRPTFNFWQLDVTNAFMGLITSVSASMLVLGMIFSFQSYFDMTSNTNTSVTNTSIIDWIKPIIFGTAFCTTFVVATKSIAIFGFNVITPTLNSFTVGNPYSMPDDMRLRVAKYGMDTFTLPLITITILVVVIMGTWHIIKKTFLYNFLMLFKLVEGASYVKPITEGNTELIGTYIKAVGGICITYGLEVILFFWGLQMLTDYDMSLFGLGIGAIIASRNVDRMLGALGVQTQTSTGFRNSLIQGGQQAVSAFSKVTALMGK
ncbi:MAG: conjugal transfer protein TrbL family protein [Mycoplasmatales bacterium]